jgi:hypothetical protein
LGRKVVRARAQRSHLGSKSVNSRHRDR